MVDETEFKHEMIQFLKDDIWPVEFICSNKFQRFIDKIPEAVFISDHAGNIIQFNNQAILLSGYEKDEISKITIEDLLPPEMKEQHIKLRQSYFKKPFSRLMGEGGLKLFIYNKDKKKIPMEAALFSIQSDQGALAVNLLRDISEQVKEQKEIVKKALHDELTGLPNRYYLYEMAEHMIGQAKREKSLLMVIILDLDKFKPVNDTLGHYVGDLLLIELGKRLRALKRQNEFVARLGGDEFVYLAFSKHENDHEGLPKRIIRACNEPFQLKGHTIHISGSIGLVLEGGLDKDIKTMLKSADKNLYEAKKKGGGQAVIS